MGVLDNGAEIIPGAVSKEALTAATKAANAKDTVGFQQLLLSGHVLPIKAGTRALVIDTTWTTRRVRLTEGPHSGAAVWVPMEFVKQP